ncbi:MAG: UDP-2,3-diacylglucosamine diphosphatase [Saprospiraceae bacterium]|nr:UDP-2,3-diacylglucosamine diphosphatase [Saprospiraceae bacterium]
MKKTYFASDFHLGIDGAQTSVEREKLIVEWLDAAAPDMQTLYLVGDIWDYWFEYGQVIPKGYSRILGCIGRLRDAGIPIYYFTGNHDMWMFRYLTEEFGIPIYRKAVTHTIDGKKFYIGHGDGLGPGDHGYKMIKKIFANPVSQWLFARIHPNTGLRLMKFFSGTSRQHTEIENFLVPEKEWLIQYAREVLQKEDIDYFVFGHRHLPIEFDLGIKGAKYFNLGDWLKYNSYAVWDGTSLHLSYYKPQR